jgi:hypothetical protein
MLKTAGRLGKRVVSFFRTATIVFVIAAAHPVTAAGIPDLSGLWLRTGDLWFDAISDTDPAKPVQRLETQGPDAEDIWAGDYNNGILQPWARAIVQRNAESEIHLHHVFTADDTCWPSGVPQAVNLIGPVRLLQSRDRIEILYERDHQVVGSG